MINSLLLKIKYKLYISILFTSISFVFAFIFKFIVRGPNPGNSPLSPTPSSAKLGIGDGNCFFLYMEIRVVF